MKKWYLSLAYAACVALTVFSQPSLSASITPTTITYSPGVGQWATVNFSVTWKNTGTTFTGAPIDLSPASTSRTTWMNGGTQMSPAPTTQVYATQSTSGNIIKMWNSESPGTANVFLTGQFKKQQSATYSGSFYLYFSNTSYIIPKALYTQTFDVRFFPEPFVAGQNPTTTPTLAQFTCTIDVPGLMRISILDSAASSPDYVNAVNYSLSWSDLTLEQTKTFAVWMVSNYSVKLQVKSLNMGYLKNGSEQVAYALKYNGGASIDLSSGGFVDVGASQPASSTEQGTPYQFSITQTPSQTVSAGSYTDTLTFSIVSG